MCYLPVGSEQAVKHYAQACLEAGVGMIKPVGNERNAAHKNQRALSNRPHQISTTPIQEMATMIKPMPTMMRKPKNGMMTGGRSSGR